MHKLVIVRKEVLRSLGIDNYDVCFVCVENDFQSSLEITNLLKDFGAKYVISKSSRDIQTKFLLRNGADEVIDPERNIAEKLAVRCSANHVLIILSSQMISPSMKFRLQKAGLGEV